jgi:hypothetical protein
MGTVYVGRGFQASYQDLEIKHVDLSSGQHVGDGWGFKRTVRNCTILPGWNAGTLFQKKDHAKTVYFSCVAVDNLYDPCPIQSGVGRSEKSHSSQ